MMQQVLPPEIRLSQGALRLLQRTLDLVNREDIVSAKGVVTRHFESFVPGMPYWAWRVFNPAWLMLQGDDFDGRNVFIKESIQRAIDLTERLGPHGELCAVCMKKNLHYESERATHQVVEGSDYEPVPVCSEHIEEAKELWQMRHGAQAEPVGRIWPPWSVVPTWGQRKEDTFSGERYAYAAWQEALDGDSDGMFYVAMCYELGLGMARSADSAAEWYKKASEKGYPGAKEGMQRCEQPGPWKAEAPVNGVSDKPFWMH